MTETTDTIATLMARDPLEYTEQDFDAIIDYIRSRRAEWKKEGASKTKKAASLEDLDL